MLRKHVIRPIEDKLDLLSEQVHEAPEEEPEPEPRQPESDSDASIPEKPKRMSVVTITPTQSMITTTLTSHSRSPPSGTARGPAGGGGGGRGGGGIPAQPAANQPAAAPHGNGKLEGKEPTIFSGDRAKADKFMHELKLYQFLNANAPIMTDPYQKVAHALTFIQGAAVAEWK